MVRFTSELCSLDRFFLLTSLITDGHQPPETLTERLKEVQLTSWGWWMVIITQMNREYQWYSPKWPTFKAFVIVDRMCEIRMRDGMTAWESISHKSDRRTSGFIWTNTKIFKISQVWKMHNSSFEWMLSLNKYCFIQIQFLLCWIIISNNERLKGLSVQNWSFFD